jgi:hypothetical protein
MIPLNTLKVLRSWARWGESIFIDYPSKSAFFGERALKTPLYGTGHIPEGVAEMEHAICALSYDQRYLIIQRYCRKVRYFHLGRLLGVSNYLARQRLKAAEAEVHRQFERVYEMQELLSRL